MNRLILLIFSMVSFLFGQNKINTTISGFVFDEANQEAIIGANVYIEELLIGSSTNVSGYYVITDVPAGTNKVQTSYMGYKNEIISVDVKAGESIKLNIFLKEEIIETETIVVSADSIPIAVKMFQADISSIKLTPIQLAAIPQIAEADLLRTLQTLPGILPLSDFSSALYIRGGTPDQNLYLLDGTDVYNPEHAFGVFSTFNTDAIKQVDLSKGGFGAERGGRLSSMIDITNLDGNREEFEGKASISLLSAKTTLQMPLGKSGSLSGAIRRTYFDQTIAKAVDEIPDYYFYDGNIKAFFDLDANNKLTLSAYGGRDVLDLDFNTGDDFNLGFKYDWGNYTGSAKWTHVFNPKLFSNFWVTGSRFSSHFKFEGIEVTEENILNDITVKGSMEYHYSNNLNFNFGFEQKLLNLQYTTKQPSIEVQIEPTFSNFVAYLSTGWKPKPTWDIKTGLRFNFFNADKNYTTLAPRLAVKHRLDDKSTLKFSTGLYHQFLHRIPRFFIADIWTASGEELRPSSSTHIVLGYQRELADYWQLEVETYFKTYKDIYSYDQNFITDLEATEFNEKGDPIFQSAEPLLDRGKGNSLGFEVLLRRDVGLLTGWAGYSFATTEYTIKTINQGNAFEPRHDRKHTINLVSSIDIDNSIRWMYDRPIQQDSSRWSLGVNFVFSTGQPITEPGSVYLGITTPNDPSRNVVFHPTEINQVRLPVYARLDLSLTWTLLYDSWKMSPYLQIYNVGNRKNVWFASYNYTNGVPDYEEQYMFPFLPTVGVNFEF